MSCDHQRENFIIKCIPPGVSDLIGAPGPARDYIETLFDLARRQPLPENKAERLSLMAGATAAYQRMQARAAKEGINLHPHKAASNLPQFDVQLGWKAVADVFDAVEKGAALPPLAADLQQSSAFACLTAKPSVPTLWEAPISPATRQQLRAAWAADLGRVTAAVDSPAALGGEEHAAWLREMTEAIIADPRTPMSLGSAASYYRLLDDEEMVGPEERAAWAQVLAKVAGVGTLPHLAGARQVCTRCGLLDHGLHQCVPAVAAQLGTVVAAVTTLMTDPMYAATPTHPSPHAELDRLLEPTIRAGVEPPTGSPEAVALAAARAVDRAFVAGLAEPGTQPRPKALRPADAQRLRDATIRTPLLFAGRRCIWDGDGLYPEDAYRKAANWDRWREDGKHGGILYRDQHVDLRLATIDGPMMARMMAGEPATVRSVRIDPMQQPDLFERKQVAPSAVRTLDIQVEECGCVFYCTSASEESVTFSWRYEGKPSCSHPPSRTYDRTSPDVLSCVNTKRPRYTVPTWPAPSEEVPNGV